jgi:hypothetical protein
MSHNTGMGAGRRDCKPVHAQLIAKHLVAAGCVLIIPFLAALAFIEGVAPDVH